jgi:hypothetical protein
MKNVMILAVSFPPTGGVGVIRTLKFTKYLPAFGWRPIVVTLPAGKKHIRDDSLSSEISPETIVHRPDFSSYRNHLPKIVAKFLQSIENRMVFPDKYVRWNKAAFNHISERILPKQKIDLIYTSVGPHSTLLLAHALKKRHGIPIFIDFRDPFSFSQYALLDDKKDFRLKARRIEEAVFKDADHINHVSRIWKEKYEDLYPEISSKSSLIHNGYDEADFTHLGDKVPNKVFTLGYNGTFSRIVPMEPLISAISEIHQRQGITMQLSIATPIKKEKLASRYAYMFENNLLDHKGFLPHRESLKNVHQSDVSVLILDSVEATEGMIPAKTFEYLRVANPILLLHRKKSFLAEIIEKTNTGITVNIFDRQEIAQALLMLQKQWRENRLGPTPNWPEIQTYERRHLTAQLSEIFNTLSGGSASPSTG